MSLSMKGGGFPKNFKGVPELKITRGYREQVKMLRMKELQILGIINSIREPSKYLSVLEGSPFLTHFDENLTYNDNSNKMVLSKDMKEVIEEYRSYLVSKEKEVLSDYKKANPTPKGPLFSNNRAYYLLMSLVWIVMTLILTIWKITQAPQKFGLKKSIIISGLWFCLLLFTINTHDSSSFIPVAIFMTGLIALIHISPRLKYIIKTTILFGESIETKGFERDLSRILMLLISITTLTRVIYYLVQKLALERYLIGDTSFIVVSLTYIPAIWTLISLKNDAIKVNQYLNDSFQQEDEQENEFDVRIHTISTITTSILVLLTFVLDLFWHFDLDSKITGAFYGILLTVYAIIGYSMTLNSSCCEFKASKYINLAAIYIFFFLWSSPLQRLVYSFLVLPFMRYVMLRLEKTKKEYCLVAVTIIHIAFYAFYESSGLTYLPTRSLRIESKLPNMQDFSLGEKIHQIHLLLIESSPAILWNVFSLGLQKRNSGNLFLIQTVFILGCYVVLLVKMSMMQIAVLKMKKLISIQVIPMVLRVALYFVNSGLRRVIGNLSRRKEEVEIDMEEPFKLAELASLAVATQKEVKNRREKIGVNGPKVTNLEKVEIEQIEDNETKVDEKGVEDHVKNESNELKRTENEQKNRNEV